MANMARCKFRCTHVEKLSDQHANVFLEAQYDQSSIDDRSFAKNTPDGSMRISLSNEHVIPLFEEGRTYVVEITPDFVSNDTPSTSRAASSDNDSDDSANASHTSSPEATMSSGGPEASYPRGNASPAPRTGIDNDGAPNINAGNDGRPGGSGGRTSRS